MSQRKKLKTEDSKGKHSLVLFERCSYVWKLTKNADGRFASRSPVFPRKDGQTFNYWFMEQHGLSSFAIVLKSCPLAVDLVEAEYSLKTTRNISGSSPQMKVGTGIHKFKVGVPSPWQYHSGDSTSTESLHVEVVLKAYVEERKSGPNFVTFSPYLDNRKFSDMRIVCGKKSIPAHRIVLATHSPVFAAMFERDMKENLEGRIDIVDFEPHVVDAMISFMYSGNKPDMTYKTAVELLGIADKYDIPTLKDLCTSYLLESIDDSTVAEMIVLADTYNIESLKKNAMNYFCNNASKFGDRLDGIINTIKTKRPDVMNSIIAALVTTLACYQSRKNRN